MPNILDLIEAANVTGGIPGGAASGRGRKNTVTPHKPVHRSPGSAPTHEGYSLAGLLAALGGASSYSGGLFSASPQEIFFAPNPRRQAPKPDPALMLGGASMLGGPAGSLINAALQKRPAPLPKFEPFGAFDSVIPGPKTPFDSLPDAFKNDPIVQRNRLRWLGLLPDPQTSALTWNQIPAMMQSLPTRLPMPEDSVTRDQIEQYRSDYFDSINPKNAPIPLQIATALAKDPKDTAALKRYQEQSVVGRVAILEKVNELRQIPRFARGTSTGERVPGVPDWLVPPSGFASNTGQIIPDNVVPGITELVAGPEFQHRIDVGKGGYAALKIAQNASEPMNIITNSTMGPLFGNPYTGIPLSLIFAGQAGMEAKKSFEEGDTLGGTINAAGALASLFPALHHGRGIVEGFNNRRGGGPFATGGELSGLSPEARVQLGETSDASAIKPTRKPYTGMVLPDIYEAIARAAKEKIPEPQAKSKAMQFLERFKSDLRDLMPSPNKPSLQLNSIGIEGLTGFLYAGAELAGKGLSAAEWSTNMLAKYGTQLKPHLPALWAESLRIAKMDPSPYEVPVAKLDRNGKLSPGGEAKRFVDIGELKMGLKKLTFENWYRQMVGEFGIEYEPHLQSLWDDFHKRNNLAEPVRDMTLRGGGKQESEFKRSSEFKPVNPGGGEAIGELHDSYMNNRRSFHQWLDHAPVTPRLVKALKRKLGIDVRGYDHRIDTGAMSHIINEHGETSNKVVDNKGKPVTREVMTKLYEVATNPDRITYAGLGPNGLHRFKLTKRMGDKLVYIMEVRVHKKFGAVTYFVEDQTKPRKK